MNKFEIETGNFTYSLEFTPDRKELTYYPGHDKVWYKCVIVPQGVHFEGKYYESEGPIFEILKDQSNGYKMKYTYEMKEIKLDVGFIGRTGAEYLPFQVYKKVKEHLIHMERDLIKCKAV